MLRRRLIPILYLLNGFMARSQLFKQHQMLGHPKYHVDRLVEWDVDEVIILDISSNFETFNTNRSDYRDGTANELEDFIKLVSTECRIPLTIGGGIRDLAGARRRIQNGADKISINTALFTHPEQVREIINVYGSQSLVASIDYVMDEQNYPRVYLRSSNQSGNLDFFEETKRIINLGVGELLINAVDRDGKANGYDCETIQKVIDLSHIPVIACGGAGHQSHFLEVAQKTNVSAIAAGNIFHFTENSYPNFKDFLKSHGENFR